MILLNLTVDVFILEIGQHKSKEIQMQMQFN